MNERISKARDVLHIASSLVVSVAALLMVGVYLYDRANPPGTAPAYIEDWETWRDTGVRVGPDDADMVIAGFMDFTCPFCQQLMPVIDSVLTKFPDEVAFQFHHFPLTGREFAMPSAIAAECAAEQGRFVYMYRLLYSQMDSIGIKSWDRFAAQAGVSDLRRFTRCIEMPAESFERISAGRALGEEIGVFATPTVWINGEQFTARNVTAFSEKAQELGVGG